MARKRQKKPTIPKKAQIPMMVVGLIIFIWQAIVVLGPLLGDGSADTAPPTQAPAQVKNSTSSTPRPTPVLEKKAAVASSESVEIKELLNQLGSVREGVKQTRSTLDLSRKNLGEGLETVPLPTALSDNNAEGPFSKLPADIWTSSNVIPDTNTGQQEKPRDTRLRGMNLQGTLLMGGDALAIVGSEVVRKGELVNGFLVENIEEGVLTLRDENGSLRLEMEGIRN